MLFRSTWVVCERQEAVDVSLAYLKTHMGAECQYFPRAAFSDLPSLGYDHLINLKLKNALGLLYSPHEFRVESREAIPQLANFLQHEMDVDFYWETEVLAVEGATLHTGYRQLDGQKVVVCPGAELTGIAKPYVEKHDLQLCTLQMLRIKPQDGFILPGSVMTDNSLARYLGWSELPEATALKDRIALEMPEYLEEGIHLIVVQSADGTLVVGDSHRYGPVEDVFASQKIDQLIIQLVYQVLDISEHTVIERWTGVYPSSRAFDALIEKVSDQIRIAIVTSGTGASTAFGLAKENLDDWIEK